MSSDNKRCSSGNTPTTRTPSLASLKQTSSLSRSKTCGFTGTTSIKSKPERLQPLVTNNNSQINDDKLVNLFFVLLFKKNSYFSSLMRLILLIPQW